MNVKPRTPPDGTFPAAPLTCGRVPAAEPAPKLWQGIGSSTRRPQPGRVYRSRHARRNRLRRRLWLAAAVIAGTAVYVVSWLAKVLVL